MSNRQQEQKDNEAYWNQVEGCKGQMKQILDNHMAKIRSQYAWVMYLKYKANYVQEQATIAAKQRGTDSYVSSLRSTKCNIEQSYYNPLQQNKQKLSEIFEQFRQELNQQIQTMEQWINNQIKNYDYTAYAEQVMKNLQSEIDANVSEHPSDLPSTNEQARRLKFLKDSTWMFPQNYPNGWGREAALQELWTSSMNKDVWKQYKKMITETWHDDEFEKAIDLVLGIANGESSALRRLKGYLVGLFDEPTDDNKIRRWVNTERLAELFQTSANDWFKSKVKSHPNPYCLIDSDLPFETFLQMYGENKNTWEEIILDQPPKHEDEAPASTLPSETAYGI